MQSWLEGMELVRFRQLWFASWSKLAKERFFLRFISCTRTNFDAVVFWQRMRCQCWLFQTAWCCLMWVDKALIVCQIRGFVQFLYLIAETIYSLWSIMYPYYVLIPLFYLAGLWKHGGQRERSRKGFVKDSMRWHVTIAPISTLTFDYIKITIEIDPW